MGKYFYSVSYILIQLLGVCRVPAWAPDDWPRVPGEPRGPVRAVPRVQLHLWGGAAVLECGEAQ